MMGQADGMYRNMPRVFPPASRFDRDHGDTRTTCLERLGACHNPVYEIPLWRGVLLENEHVYVTVFSGRFNNGI